MLTNFVTDELVERVIHHPHDGPEDIPFHEPTWSERALTTTREIILPRHVDYGGYFSGSGQLDPAGGGVEIGMFSYLWPYLSARIGLGAYGLGVEDKGLLYGGLTTGFRVQPPTRLHRLRAWEF